MAIETVDALELEIRSRAESAARDIASLATSVGDFGKSVRRYINNLNDFASSIKAIADAAAQLGRVSNLGKMLEKIAPVAAAMKAKLPTSTVKGSKNDWRRQMFPNDADYNAIFQPKGFNKGKRPEKILYKGNDSSYVMDVGDVSKRGARMLSRDISGRYGISNRELSLKLMDEYIARVRSGSGRTEGANQAWMTKEAETALTELASFVTSSAHPNYDGDLIDRLRATGMNSIRLGRDDIGNMMSGGFSMADMRRSLAAYGIKVTSDKTASTIDEFNEALGLNDANKPFGTVIDLLEALDTAYQGRNTAFLGGMGGTEGAIQAVKEDLLRGILDIGVKNERSMLAPDAEEVQKAMKESFDAQSVQQEAAQAAAEIKGAVSEVVQEAKQAAVGGLANATQTGYPKWLPGAGPWQVGNPTKQFNPVTKQFEDIQKSAEAAAPAVERVTAAVQEAKTATDTSWAKNITAPNVVGKTVKQFNPATGQYEDIAKAASGASQLQENLSEAAGAAKDLSGASRQVDDFIKDAGKSSVSLKNAFSYIGKEIKHSLIGQISRVAKMRGLRYLVRSLASGMKEGLSNLYQWSNAIGGPFASAMDTIASKTMLAKNSLATAFAPAIQALVPIISTVVSWINAASNAIAQFFALLGGKTSWVRATETAENWADAVKAGGGGAKAAHEDMKDLLADWDELNIIQSETGSGGGGGGGGGGAASNFADMFEETDVFDKWTRYFDEIKTIVAAIGAGIAGWYLVERASDFLKAMGFAEGKVNKISGILKEGLGGLVILTISFALASAAGKSIALDGLTLENVAMTVGGLLGGALGGFLVGDAAMKALALAGIAAPQAALVGAITGLAVAAIVELKAYLDTKEQIAYDLAKEWVYANAFDYDVEAKLKLDNVTVTNVRAARAALKDSVSSLLGTINALKLGINDSETINQLKTQLGDEESGVIHDLNVYASEAKNVIKLFYTMNPKTEGEGGIDSAASYLKASKGWDLLTGKLETLGNELGQYIVDGETAQIKEGYEDVVAGILDQIAKITAAVTSAKISSELMIDLNATIASDAAHKIPEVLKDLEDRSRETAENLYDERLRIAQELVDGLKGAGATNTQEYKDAVEELNQLITPGARNNYIDSYIAGIMGNANEKVTQYYADKFAKGPLEEFFAIMFNKAWTDEELEDFGPEYTIDDFINRQIEAQLSEIPKDIYGWLADHGFNWEDYMTDEQRRNLQDARDRAANMPVKEEVPEILATEAEEIAETVEETTSAIEDVKDGMEGLGDVLNGGLQKIFEESGMEGLAEYLNNKDLGSLEFIIDSLMSEGVAPAVTELAKAILDRKESEERGWDSSSGGGGNPNWYDPSQGLLIDTAGSGAAMDSTVSGVGETINSSAAALESIANTIASRIAELITTTSGLANRPINVNVNASSGWGDMNSRSGRMYDKITGMNS